MTVIYLDNEYSFTAHENHYVLTPFKTYEVFHTLLGSNGREYNLHGIPGNYSDKLFMEISEYRNSQINIVLDGN